MLPVERVDARLITPPRAPTPFVSIGHDVRVALRPDCHFSAAPMRRLPGFGVFAREHVNVIRISGA